MRFWLALLCSLLAHGVFYSLLLQQQAKPVRAAAAKPAPLQVSLLKRPINNSAASATATAAKPAPIAATVATAPVTKPQARHPQSKALTTQARPQSNRKSAQVATSANRATAATAPTSTAAITAPDFATILEQARNQAQQRPLTSAELQAITSNNLGYPEPTAKTQQALNPAHLSQDVLIAFDNGSQLVKVGKDRCVITANGADLQKDIQGMKLAPRKKGSELISFGSGLGSVRYALFATSTDY